jgi:hypothetical protein
MSDNRRFYRTDTLTDVEIGRESSVSISATVISNRNLDSVQHVNVYEPQRLFKSQTS